MKNYFLVDYENVREIGLEGIFNLGENDKIIVFYTKNANNISLDFVKELLIKGVKANLEFINVPAGNQSLDKLLISQLGFLIGSTYNDVAHFIIVSKDKGYQNTIDYWNQVKPGIIEIKTDLNYFSEEKKISSKEIKIEVKSVTNETQDKKEVALNKKSIMNQNVQQILSKDKAKYSNDIISKAASICAKKCVFKNHRNSTRTALVKELGSELGMEIYTKLDACMLFN